MDWITPLLSVVSESLKLANAKYARQWLDEFTRTRLEIQDEESKGDLSDDAKIESLYQKLEILAKAAENEVRNYSSSLPK
jgi:hypothetical protein